MAVPFDPVRLAVTGDATGLIDGVMQAANRNLSDMDNTLAAQFTVSDTGALVYVTGGAVPAAERSLAWVDRQGTSQALPAPPRPYPTPRLSPDGQRVAVSTQRISVRCGATTSRAARSARSPLTGRAVTAFLRQTGNGSSSARARRAVRTTCIGRPPTGAGPRNASPRVRAARRQPPGRPTGRRSPLSKREIPWQSSFSSISGCCRSAIARPVRSIQTAANEMSPEFSPDGRWLAYVSNQSGRHEVYVQPYPGPGERHLISTNGGEQPAWSGNGRELFYVQGGEHPAAGRELMSVSIGTTPAFLAGTPETLFESVDLQSAWGRNYDVAPDGRRFLLTLNKEPPTIGTGPDDFRAELVRGAEAPRADEVTLSAFCRRGKGQRVRERALCEPQHRPNVSYRQGAHQSADNWLTIGSGCGWIRVGREWSKTLKKSRGVGSGGFQLPH